VTDLFDGNVLVALSVPEHVHHEPATRWRAENHDLSFATCPITEGTLVRLLVREGRSTDDAGRVLRGLAAHPLYEFWPDDVSYQDVRLGGVIGHRQVTDAYLAQLARNRGGRLVTLDAGLAALHDDVTALIPTD
jgi:uncharacterized protein